jgi:hypothetical protein
MIVELEHSGVGLVRSLAISSPGILGELPVSAPM